MESIAYKLCITLVFILMSGCSSNNEEMRAEILDIRDQALRTYVLSPENAEDQFLHHKEIVLHHYDKIDAGWAESMLAMIHIRLAFLISGQGAEESAVQEHIDTAYSHYRNFCGIRNQHLPSLDEFVELIKHRDELLRESIQRGEVRGIGVRVPGRSQR